MKALFELFRRFDARCIFGSIRRLGGMSRPKVKCYDLRSTHALRVEGDIKGFRKKVIVYQISIHALRVEGDVNLANVNLCHVISIHTLRVEGDGTVHRRVETEFYFYPRPPGGGRQLEDCRKHLVDYFYPRPPGGGRLHTHCSRKYRVRHFYPRPPGGGRLKLVEYNVIDVTISIHALRVEGDTKNPLLVLWDDLFLSTPSGWRATAGPLYHAARRVDFYPRPPGGGRQREDKIVRLAQQISIHALRVEGDYCPECAPLMAQKISIHALRVEGDSSALSIRAEDLRISIHALRVEGDHLPLSFLHTVLYFYPRPPGWRATTVGRIACAFEQFLSTPSGWRATIITLAYGAEKILISIHALRVEGDEQPRTM